MFKRIYMVGVAISISATVLAWEEDTITDLGCPIPGVSNIWTLTTGKDGKIYGGTSDGWENSYLFVYNPQTQSFTDLGLPGIEVYTLTTGEDSLIYGGSFKAPPAPFPDTGAHFFVYDPREPWNPGVNPEDLGEVPPTWELIASNKNGRIYGGGGNGEFYSYAPRLPWNPGVADTSNPRNYGETVPGEVRVRSLTVGEEGFIYGGTAFQAHTFVFVPRPIDYSKYTIRFLFGNELESALSEALADSEVIILSQEVFEDTGNYVQSLGTALASEAISPSLVDTIKLVIIPYKYLPAPRSKIAFILYGTRYGGRVKKVEAALADINLDLKIIQGKSYRVREGEAVEILGFSWTEWMKCMGKNLPWCYLCKFANAHVVECLAACGGIAGLVCFLDQL